MIHLRKVDLWLIILTTIIIYAFKIPNSNIAVYKIIYPLYTIFLFLFLILKQIRLGKTIKIMLGCWSVMLTWGLILSIYYGCVIQSFEQLWYFCCLICVSFCFSLLMNNEKNKRVIMFTFIVISMLIAVIGIYTGVTGNYIHLTHISYQIYKNYLGLYRPNTIFYNINDNAVFMFFSLTITYLFTEKHKRRKLIRIFSLVLHVGNILLVNSRGVLLATMLFLFCYYWKVVKKKNKIVFLVLALMIGIVCVEFILSFFGNTIFADGLNTGRDNLWKISIESLADTMYMGCGPGRITQLNSYRSSSTIAVHNFFLEIFCDYGMVGGSCMLIWYSQMIKSSLKYAKICNEGLIILLSVILFIIVSVVSSSLIGKSWLLIYIGILIGTIDKNDRCTEIG